MKRSNSSAIRTYRGVTIWPKNVHGMYSAVCLKTTLAADTLAGIRSLIDQEYGDAHRDRRRK